MDVIVSGLHPKLMTIIERDRLGLGWRDCNLSVSCLGLYLQRICYFFFYCGGVFTRVRNKCISNSNVSIKTMCILCAGCCFSGLFCDSAALSRLGMHKRACAQIFWEDLGKENMFQQGGGGRESCFCPFLFCVITTVQNPASQPTLAKESLIGFKLSHGERKEDPPIPIIMASLCFPLLIFPPKVDINLISFSGSVSLIISTQPLRAAVRGSWTIIWAYWICSRPWERGVCRLELLASGMSAISPPEVRCVLCC